MPLQQSDLIEVKQTKSKGRGVFARKAIEEGTIIEKVPMLVVPDDELVGTKLADYAFFWGKKTVALAMGYGSIYNHSFEPNAEYQDTGRQTKTFIALRDIKKGEEITVNYNGDPDDKSPMDFDVI